MSSLRFSASSSLIGEFRNRTFCAEWVPLGMMFSGGRWGTICRRSRGSILQCRLKLTPCAFAAPSNSVIRSHMLPALVESLLREQLDVDLRLNQFRPPAFGQRALAKSFGGTVLQPSKLVGALWGEIDLLGSVALEAMRKVL